MFIFDHSPFHGRCIEKPPLIYSAWQIGQQVFMISLGWPRRDINQCANSRCINFLSFHFCPRLWFRLYMTYVPRAVDSEYWGKYFCIWLSVSKWGVSLDGVFYNMKLVMLDMSCIWYLLISVALYSILYIAISWYHAMRFWIALLEMEILHVLMSWPEINRILCLGPHRPWIIWKMPASTWCTPI